MTATSALPTCPHPLTEANCASGSFREIEGVRTFIPMASVCENCKVHACDDCAESWPGTCACCGGGICGPCAATARSRRVTEASDYGAPYRTRTEFLCTKCASAQDAAKVRLLNEVTSHMNGDGSVPAISTDSRWLSDIVDSLTEELRTAKEAL